MLHFFEFSQNKVMSSIISVLLIISMALFPLQISFASEKAESNETAQSQSATEDKKKTSEEAEKAKEEYKKSEETYKATNASVKAINAKIESLESKILDLIKEIQDLQVVIEKKQVAVDKMYNNFKGRLKSIYMSGSYTTVQALFGSDDFSDYLTKAEMIKAVSTRDKETIEEMRKAFADLEKKKKKLDDKRVKLELQEATLQTSKSELELKKAEAAKEYNKSLELYQKVEKINATTKAQIDKEQKELSKIVEMCKKEASVSKEIAEALKDGKNDLKSEIISNGGMLCFPVPQCRDVSCGFYGYTNHNGMDFANAKVNGKKVVAAADGKIMKVELLDYSYGHHIWINHGKNTATLYAHLSRIVVKEGQIVKKGQVIGYVGSTGNSTGPHLHFGLLIGGKFVNPINYF